MTTTVPTVPATAAGARAPGRPADARRAPRFFTEEDCRDIARRITEFSAGGGATGVNLASWWRGGVRWARNQVVLSSDIADNKIQLIRTVKGATCDAVCTNDVSDAGLAAALRRAERLLQSMPEERAFRYATQWNLEPMEKARFFSEATFGLEEEARAKYARELARAAAEAGMLSAGYLEAYAGSVAQVDSTGRLRYYPYTYARYSVTVRDPKGTGSGWAGQDHWDWAKIDAAKLSQVALDKCLKSMNPVRLEPARYTAILEPQAVADLVSQLFGGAMDRERNEDWGDEPFSKRRDYSRLGDRVVDQRITASADPNDPELAPALTSFMVPGGGIYADVYHPATWIKDGRLVNLGYDGRYARRLLGGGSGLPNSGGFRMALAGQTSTVEEMIQSTKRGVLVTRFSNVQQLDRRSQLYRGYTRDGLWLIEDGKISKPVKNLQFTQSLFGMLNSIDAFGVPQRAFHPDEPLFRYTKQSVIVPALKVRDFSFTALSDAV